MPSTDFDNIQMGAYARSAPNGVEITASKHIEDDGLVDSTSLVLTNEDLDTLDEQGGDDLINLTHGHAILDSGGISGRNSYAFHHWADGHAVTVELDAVLEYEATHPIEQALAAIEDAYEVFERIDDKAYFGHDHSNISDMLTAVDSVEGVEIDNCWTSYEEETGGYFVSLQPTE